MTLFRFLLQQGHLAGNRTTRTVKYMFLESFFPMCNDFFFFFLLDTEFDTWIDLPENLSGSQQNEVVVYWFIVWLFEFSNLELFIANK